MKKALRAIVFLVLGGAACQAAAEDRVSIVNRTDRSLHFKMRCVSHDGKWQAFEVPSGGRIFITAPICRYFGFEKSTRDNDGDIKMVKYKLSANTYHALTFNKKKGAFDLRLIGKADYLR